MSSIKNELHKRMWFLFLPDSVYCSVLMIRDAVIWIAKLW